ncbi:VOC family protein [Bradyrhizobium prioriisuperbiae]|uniref:VOC family protein n=1 Tax=Bradyrhizobium prioriisuperbiae TaxID=2854389 RepID=UPI0028E77A6E|nr:VOC family protein [Bradyrhizobium prioritasuperba]
MLLYLTLGTNDLTRAKRFYESTMPVLGLELRTANEREFGYGNVGDSTSPWLWVNEPYDKQPASFGNGSMIAFVTDTRAKVDAFYQAALSNGGSNDGAPGLRSYHASFYACYVRDPDGNKLSAVCEKPD